MPRSNVNSKVGHRTGVSCHETPLHYCGRYSSCRHSLVALNLLGRAEAQSQQLADHTATFGLHQYHCKRLPA